MAEFHQSKNGQWYDIFDSHFQLIFCGRKVLQSHHAFVDFSPLLFHLLNNFKTRMLQLNLTGARRLKNIYVLTSSRKKRAHITSECPVRQKIGNRRLVLVRHWRIHLAGKKHYKPPNCKKTFRVFTILNS